MKNVIRLILLIAVMFYFPTELFNTAVFAVKEKIISANKEGVGGAIYSDTEIEELLNEEIVSGEMIEGIPEPEEFSKAQSLIYSIYEIQPGDMIGYVAQAFGLNQDTLISINDISNTRAIRAGKTLLIPNQNGIIHTVAQGETIRSIAEKSEVNVDSIVIANELFSENVKTGSVIFLPEAKLDSTKLQEINGDLFIWPITSRRITSRYGYRTNPVSGVRGFHSGLDISANTGARIGAAMAGRVISTGYNATFGNFVVISHHANYRTLYGHMNVISTRSGNYVRTGDKIGEVGNTGQSTGSHLHFQVYKNGVTVNPLILMSR